MTTTSDPELIHPSAVASFLQVAFNPREDIEVNLDGSSFVHSSDAPHRIYEAPKRPPEAPNVSEQSEESKDAEFYAALKSYLSKAATVESKAPKESEASEQPEAQKESEAPEQPEAPKESEVSEQPEAPKEAEAPEQPEAPKESEASEQPEAPKESEAPEQPEAPKESEAPEQPEAPHKAKSDEEVEFVASLKAKAAFPGPDEPSLHVFLTGTGAPALTRDKCRDFLSTTVPFGVSTIALSYEWLSLTDSARNSMIDDDWSMDLETKHAALKLCHDDICFGTQEGRVSPAKTGAYHQVHLSECITQRLVRLLTYLHFQNPERGWDEYLMNTTEEEAAANPSDSIILQGDKSFIATINWSKIILSGHSQGAGHAAFIAMHRKVGRVALFSGPQEGLEDGFYEADKQHWLSKEIATPRDCWYALKHAKEEGTARLIRDNWTIMPAFKEKYFYRLEILNIKSTSYARQISDIRQARRRSQLRPKLFETFIPYDGYKEGVEKPGRPYHCSTVIDGSVPMITTNCGATQDGHEEESMKECVYKKIIWPFMLVGDRGLMAIDPSELQGYWAVRTEADILPGGLLPEDKSPKYEYGDATPLHERKFKDMYFLGW